MTDIPLKSESLLDTSSFHSRLRNRRHRIKSYEARENKRRTPEEKIADFMTDRFGTMSFLIFNSVVFIIWMFINIWHIPFLKSFDPFPFVLLTTAVSLEAIILSIVVLISQKRASKIDDIRDEISLQIETIAEEEITKMMQLQVMTLNKLGVDVSADKELQQMLEPTDKSQIEKTLANELK